MKRNRLTGLFCLLFAIALFSCGKQGGSKKQVTQLKDKMIGLLTVDPGHFHAALVQKSMYENVSPVVHVYAPGGDDLDQHLERIKSYNSRAVNPTRWEEIVYTGPDFFEKMISGKAGNVVVLSGNNRKKAEYIERSMKAGLNVLADKPMIITAQDYPKLEESFKVAETNHVLLYDIMTERYEIATILQKLLSKNHELFGDLLNGSKDDPAVTKVSVHHFSKLVSGVPLKRPAWFFDTGQQGEGIVDVTTHLVDLVEWECYPDSLLSPEDVTILSARRWPTEIKKDQFSSVTGLDQYPGFLSKDLKNGILNVYSNGEFTWKLRHTWAKVSVEWKFQAPEGGGDTHYSVMKGSLCNLLIKQTADEKFQPTLYVESLKGDDTDVLEKKLEAALKELPYDSLSVTKTGASLLRVNIPSKYRVGHEEHFAQVMSKYLGYIKDGKIPEWEIAAMITKYYTTTSALKLATVLDHH